MKVRNAIKKVAALGMGVSMLGATVMGAVAAEDLANYPSPLFISGGQFNGVIVLGDNAISSDTLGAIDIATGLQFSATTSAGSAGTGTVTISDGVKIEKSGNQLNINESIGNIDPTLDDGDLPGILDDGLYDESEGSNDNEEDYTQELNFVTGANKGQVVLDQDDRDAPDGGLYVKWGSSSSDLMYNYTLEFDSKIDYDNSTQALAEDDFETSKITIQGNVYTITDIKLASGKIDQVKMQAGDTTIWLEQGQPITRVIGGDEHEVELVDVNENEDKCGIMVDGTLQWVDVSSSKKVNGVEIGVTDAITVHAESKDTDVCEVNVGATEVTLENGQEVQINGKDIDGSEVLFKETTAGELESLSIWYISDDDVYLMDGDTIADPVLGNFEFNYAGPSALYTEYRIDVSGDDLNLEFNNIDGKSVKLPFFCGGSCDATTDVVYFGTDTTIDERYYLTGGVCTGTSSVTECEGAKFLVEDGDELHVIEVQDIDLGDNETTLKDETYGGTKTTKDKIGAGASAFSLPGGAADVTLTVTGTSITFGGASIVGNNELFKTEYEGQLKIEGFRANGTNFEGNGSSVLDEASIASQFRIAVDESEGEVDSTTDTNGDTRSYVNFTMTVDTADDELNIGTPLFGRAAFSGVDVGEDNDNDKVYYDDYGTKVVHDDEDKRSATIWYPEEELFANLFISPVGANVISGSSSGAVVVQKIEVGTAKLASEVGSLSGQNTIIVGGPCANEMAADFLGVSMSSCLEGAPEPNTAVIKLKEYGNNVAMLVNGYDAIDTRRAARVLANYDDYDLMGEEVVVTGTDFTNIQVSTI